MNERERDQLLSSNYDGIQEYDNDLPRWWRWLFYLTILFGVGYYGYTLSGMAPSREEELKAELAELSSQKKAAAPVGAVDTATLVALVKDPSTIEKGKTVFAGKCAACHGPAGGGLIGPNLTDDYWIHGGSLEQIHKVIVEGVVEKGMIAWGPLLSPDEINQVFSYVWSLHGTNPENPKAPQGDLVRREG